MGSVIGQPRIGRPEALSSRHLCADFDCGNAALNHWLQRFAFVNERSHGTRTVVVCEELQVVGLYSLAVGSVAHAVSPPRIRKGLARHAVPVMVLARLAVDLRFQNAGIGRGLLKDAVIRTLSAAGIAGIRALLVHAIDEKAAAFYSRHGFTPSPIDPMVFMVLIKDLESSRGGI